MKFFASPSRTDFRRCLLRSNRHCRRRKYRRRRTAAGAHRPRRFQRKSRRTMARRRTRAISQAWRQHRSHQYPQRPADHGGAGFRRHPGRLHDSWIGRQRGHQRFRRRVLRRHRQQSRRRFHCRHKHSQRRGFKGKTYRCAEYRRRRLVDGDARHRASRFGTQSR